MSSLMLIGMERDLFIYAFVFLPLCFSLRRNWARKEVKGGGKRYHLKGWGQSAKLGTHSAICSKLGTALQAYALNPRTKFPPNPTSRKVNT